MSEPEVLEGHDDTEGLVAAQVKPGGKGLEGVSAATGSGKASLPFFFAEQQLRALEGGPVHVLRSLMPFSVSSMKPSL